MNNLYIFKQQDYFRVIFSFGHYFLIHPIDHDYYINEKNSGYETEILHYKSKDLRL